MRFSFSWKCRNLSEAATGKVLLKNKNSQDSQENTCIGIFFLKNVAGLAKFTGKHLCRSLFFNNVANPTKFAGKHLCRSHRPVT